TPIKDTAYECGMLPVGEGSTRLSVKFYLVAMLFILFDIEVVFLYPWAVVYKEMLKENAGLIFGSMISFLAILFAGYLYAVKKGALDWKSNRRDRKSTRLNSSHDQISYAVFCLKKKKKNKIIHICTI